MLTSVLPGLGLPGPIAHEGKDIRAIPDPLEQAHGVGSRGR